MKKTSNKKFGDIVTVIWALTACMNFIVYLWGRNPISLFLAGIMLGGVIIMLGHNPLMNIKDEIIDSSLHLNKELFRQIDLYKAALTQLKTKVKNRKKKVKGGKKK